MDPYFTALDTEKFSFYRVPKLLFTDEKYQTVSTDAKMLYGLLLDRLSLSGKNGWKDEHGRVYQYFTIRQAQEHQHQAIDTGRHRQRDQRVQDLSQEGHRQDDAKLLDVFHRVSSLHTEWWNYTKPREKCQFPSEQFPHCRPGICLRRRAPLLFPGPAPEPL